MIKSCVHSGIWEAEAEELWAQDQPWLHKEFQNSLGKNLFQKKKIYFK